MIQNKYVIWHRLFIFNMQLYILFMLPSLVLHKSSNSFDDILDTLFITDVAKTFTSNFKRLL